MFRHKWVYAVSESGRGEEILICKGSLLFSDRNECEANGLRYKPEVYFIREGELVLKIETCLYFGGKICVLSDKSPTPIPHYTHSEYIAHEGPVVKVTWCIESAKGSLNVFCVLNCDIWFYSHCDDILDAYHDYIHRI